MSILRTRVTQGEFGVYMTYLCCLGDVAQLVDMHEALVQSYEPTMVACTYTLWEMEAGELQVQGYPQ